MAGPIVLEMIREAHKRLLLNVSDTVFGDCADIKAHTIKATVPRAGEVKIIRSYDDALSAIDHLSPFSKQSKKKKAVRYVTCDGVTLTVQEWSKRTGLPSGTIYYRLGAGMIESDAVRLSNKRRPAARPTTVPHKNARLFTYADQTLSLTEWAKQVGIEAHTLYERLRVGWTIERTLTTPTSHSRAKRLYSHQGLSLSLADWALRTSISKGTLWHRVGKLKWPLAKALELPVMGATGGWSQTSEKGAGTALGGTRDSLPKQDFFPC